MVPLQPRGGTVTGSWAVARARTRAHRRALALAAACAALVAPGTAAAGPVPDEGDCPAITGLPGPDGEEDASAVPLKEGMRLRRDSLLALRRLVPEEIWRYREHFFHDGMVLEIGPCHRRYAVNDFYVEATERFRGKARVDRKGNLEKYRAGLPFPPETLDPADDGSGVRWAWNVAQRFRGAGHRGSFRITDFPSRVGGVQVYEGSWFLLLTRHRSDLPEQDYALEDLDRYAWVAGGEFVTPFNVRHLAWRQFRPADVHEDYEEPDDKFVYVPTMRKVRRAASAWSDGIFLPRYSASGDAGGGGMQFGNTFDGSGGTIQPTAALSVAVTEDMRRGFTGVSLRPNGYVWRTLGERDVLAPLNVTRMGYPEEPERNWGHSGLSIASDRWDLRRVVVIEGAVRDRSRQSHHVVTIYVDVQTQQPLFWITRGDRRRFLEVGILAYRYTGDVAHYPIWPDSSPTQVFEPVAAVFLDAADGGGWRRESYDLVSTPVGEDERVEMTNTAVLSRGR